METKQVTKEEALELINAAPGELYVAKTSSVRGTQNE